MCFWGSGEGLEHVANESVIPYPQAHVEAAAELPIATPPPSSDTVLFQHYLERRIAAKELQESGQDETYCPNCRLNHTVTWFYDTVNSLHFFMCGNGQSRIVFRSGGTGALKTMELHDFLTTYPFAPRMPASIFGTLIKQSQVKITPLPPFVVVTIKGD
jgi:hypothetical protein